ncbi:MAG: response regulator, partial [Bacteroidales bacterium]
KAGVLTSAEAETLNEEQTFRLLFASGVTTSPFITDISGRGLGMAIVSEKIDGLGGNIDVKSELGKGTVFTITLPQTLSTFRGVLVKAAENLFLIPTHTVLKAVLITPEEIDTIESKQIIRLNDENVGMVSLSDVLGIPKRHTTRKRSIRHGLIFQHAQKKLALLVDDLLGEHEGVVKRLGAQLKQVKNISGASLLGDGKVVPVLNMPEVLSEAEGNKLTGSFDDDELVEKTDAGKSLRVLVAEDSITVRNMLRNYLDSAGFSVITAVDGQEAYEQLQHQDVDIVVSDIEMPRMNGFELTERIRKSFGQIPVVLVTALESSGDRKRGMDAGANAYIVKSSFEKGNLIDTIKRLT